MLKSFILILLLSSLSVHAKEYLVKMKPGAAPSPLLLSVEVKKEFELLHGRFLLIDTDENIYRLILRDRSIQYAEENITLSISETDDKFKKQWGLRNTGWNSGSTIFTPGKKGRDINALKAWKLTKGSRDIKIAVIDTGVDYTHQDLKQNIMINMAEKDGIEGVDDDDNGFVDDIYGYDFANNDENPMDEHGHGTHCAGVIGAAHNKVGIMGVMSEVQILPIQFLTKTGRGTLEGAIRAIDYAIRRKVDIMSNSWGGGGTSRALQEAIEVAEEKGILFVAAAGNSNRDNDRFATLPATLPVENIVSVGAMNGKGKRATFSNYGKKTVHVFAPGVKIYSTVPKNKYKKMSGTSMACPHIAGVAGLIWAYEPNLTYQEVKQRLINSTHHDGGLNTYSVSGRVDAYKALRN